MSEASIRPWGSYEVISDGVDFKTKIIKVQPKHRLSYQRHARRSEHWFVVRGSGTVTLDGLNMAVTAGSSVDVPVGIPHRIENDGYEDLVFVEVQHGEYFGEDDILRLEDDYGRIG